MVSMMPRWQFFSLCNCIAALIINACTFFLFVWRLAAGLHRVSLIHICTSHGRRATPSGQSRSHTLSLPIYYHIRSHYNSMWSVQYWKTHPQFNWQKYQQHITLHVDLLGSCMYSCIAISVGSKSNVWRNWAWSAVNNPLAQCNQTLALTCSGVASPD